MNINDIFNLLNKNKNILNLKFIIKYNIIIFNI